MKYNESKLQFCTKFNFCNSSMCQISIWMTAIYWAPFILITDKWMNVQMNENIYLKLLCAWKSERVNAILYLNNERLSWNLNEYMNKWIYCFDWINI